jgi:hypothetical protein
MTSRLGVGFVLLVAFLGALMTDDGLDAGMLGGALLFWSLIMMTKGDGK